MSTIIDRRSVLTAAAAAVPAAAIAATPSPRARHHAFENDPALDAIADYKIAESKALDLYRKIDVLEMKAIKKFGNRPFEGISWRQYGHIGGSEIEKARDGFIREGYDRRLIAKEYKDAKARYVAKLKAGIQWDKRVRVAKLRDEYEVARADELRTLARLARVKPKTARGATALLKWIIADMEGGISSRGEHEAVLRSVAQTLPKLFVATA